MENTVQQVLQNAAEILVDGALVNENPAARFRGLGFVSGNGSSRLLMDYKYNHPEAYEEIIKLLFAPGYGAGLTHLKLEFGADINSSSGTEPCTKRTADEPADVTRGAGFQLAADAKKCNPNLTLDLLRWGEPHWVTAAFSEGTEAGFEARYRWFYETLVAAYETYGLPFDFISPDANETDHADTQWLIYFAKRLRSETDAPYDFSAIRLVASDEVGTRTVAQEMVDNADLRDAIDVIGLHYTTYGDDNTQLLHEVYGKEIWYSEGIAPCNVPALSCRTDGSGLSGVNGPLDVANRIIGSYAHGRMVMYEFQPAVAAYYDGSCYSPKQLITASTPWSGYFHNDVGLWIAAHFSKCAQPGWCYVDSACYADGDENHAITNTTHNYVTLVSPDCTQLTMHLCNDSDLPRSYLVILRNLPELAQKLYFLETAGCEDPAKADKNWFRIVDEVQSWRVKGEAGIPVVVKPHTLLTITTLETSEVGIGKQPLTPDTRLSLPYCDDFAYNEEFCKVRGNAPLYTTDQGGAFELVSTEDGGALQQMICRDALPTNWRFRGTPAPITSLGDDSWRDYQCSVMVQLSSETPDNYAGIGMRYNSAVTCAETSECGFAIRLFGSGAWQVRYMKEILAEGSCEAFDAAVPHKLGLLGIGDLIMAFIDDNSVFETRMEQKPLVRSGRVCLQSSYDPNQFRKLSVQPVPLPKSKYSDRIDCLSLSVQYPNQKDGCWELNGMADYRFYNRTCAVGTQGAVMQIRFRGCAISLLGQTEHAVITLKLDGRLYSEHREIPASRFRETFCSIDNISDGLHTLEMIIEEGTIAFDAFEIPTDSPTRLAPETVFEDPKAARSATRRAARRPNNSLKKAALPIAGAAATGLAIAFTVSRIMKKRK